MQIKNDTETYRQSHNSPVSLETARRRFIDVLQPVTGEILLPLSSAYGMVSARDITADVSVPAFSSSAMDGFAVHSADLSGASAASPVKLTVSCEIYAGDVPAFAIARGCAARIMTGGMIPPGCDAVIRQEDTDRGETEVLIFRPASPMENIRPEGENMRTGTLAVRKGQRIGRTELGICMALGIKEISLRRPARIGIIPTGSELQSPGERLSPGKIYENISLMLAAPLEREGFQVIQRTPVPDKEDLLLREIKETSAACDFVITTGGVSVGKKDLIPSVLRTSGAEIIFRNVDLMPGTPTTGSVLGGKGILSLSGNPFAALANFDLYVWHSLSKLMGCSGFLPEEKTAVLIDPYMKTNRRRRFIRVYEENGLVHLPSDVHKSSVFSNLRYCNAYMDVPAGTHAAPGDTVHILKMKGLI